ncbi:lipopolysaccharide assembly protein LapA domain-containing protein [Calditrichota bacterium]
MWIVRWIVAAIVIILILIIAIQNHQPDLSFSFLSWTWENIPLYLITLLAFVAGIVAFMLIAIADQLHLISDLRKERKENKLQLQKIEELEQNLQAAEKEKNTAAAKKLILEEKLEARNRELDRLQKVLSEPTDNQDSNPSDSTEENSDFRFKDLV